MPWSAPSGAEQARPALSGSPFTSGGDPGHGVSAAPPVPPGPSCPGSGRAPPSGDSCVEVPTCTSTTIHGRDSKLDESPQLALTPASCTHFLSYAVRGLASGTAQEPPRITRESAGTRGAWDGSGKVGSKVFGDAGHASEVSRACWTAWSGRRVRPRPGPVSIICSWCSTAEWSGSSPTGSATGARPAR
ncbi:DUF397 domain-containing protein [Streptomyces rubiginosohelvolus]|uniref:DUF397 domain-containing protein n=1 Tax=Streptomyces rubiginosohelvolus TaxID=67362 RepID=UPI0036879EED